MNKFTSTLLGSFIGTWIAFIVLSIVIFICGIIAIASLSMSSLESTTTTIEKNSVLKIKLSGTIEERQSDLDMSQFLYTNELPKVENLENLLKAIDNAKKDNHIEGIYMYCGGVNAGFATLKAVRDALIDFKTSGKWIYSYGESLAQSDYYLASVSDRILMNKVGMLDVHGIGSNIPFFKGFLDKIGVEMQVIRVGTYKSAVEPYMLTQMSEANRLQTQTFIDNIWNEIATEISASRGIDKETINLYADSLYALSNPQKAVDLKMIDNLVYDHEAKEAIMKKLGIDDDDDLNFVSPTELNQATIAPKKSANKIAVLYAVGEIKVKGSAINEIYSDKLVPVIEDAAEDDDIKGMVLRVNSPGGSAYASEQIWEALQQFKATGKPLAVSMGDYAASGGYYISCNADRIFAEPTTITGSIGIYGLIPNLEKVLNDKLGINFGLVKSNANTDMSVTKALTPFQRQSYQRLINDGYELFTKRCSDGRDIEINQLKSIAEGRVWDGQEALKNKLVDEHGNLKDAITWVAQKAKVSDDYSVESLPEIKDDFLTTLLFTLSEEGIDAKMQERYGVVYEYVKEIENILSRDKVQCRMETIVIE